jgi:hypothetical protein
MLTTTQLIQKAQQMIKVTGRSFIETYDQLMSRAYDMANNGPKSFDLHSLRVGHFVCRFVSTRTVQLGVIQSIIDGIIIVVRSPTGLMYIGESSEWWKGHLIFSD